MNLPTVCFICTVRSLIEMNLVVFCATRQDYTRLLDSDYRGTTVLMHAAGAGKSATFDSFLEAIQDAFSEEEVGWESGVFPTGTGYDRGIRIYLYIYFKYIYTHLLFDCGSTCMISIYVEQKPKQGPKQAPSTDRLTVVVSVRLETLFLGNMYLPVCTDDRPIYDNRFSLFFVRASRTNL